MKIAIVRLGLTAVTVRQGMESCVVAMSIIEARR